MTWREQGHPVGSSKIFECNTNFPAMLDIEYEIVFLKIGLLPASQTGSQMYATRVDPLDPAPRLSFRFSIAFKKTGESVYYPTINTDSAVYMADTVADILEGGRYDEISALPRRCVRVTNSQSRARELADMP
jgi:hypothetical protein